MALPRESRARDMDSASMNRYEQQLYSVFKTFDVANEEALDRDAVLQLCHSLQLEDRGAALVAELFPRAERREPERVTFAQFRAGLLAVLDPEPAERSDDDSSGREVAPKFVFGAKKYGRRSRPQRAGDAATRPRGASESRLDERTRSRPRCKRSASAMESRDDAPAEPAAPDLDHDRPVDRERALALCRGLSMSGVDRALVDRVFDACAADEVSVGEFFDRLNASLASSIAASLDAVGADDGDTLAGEAVVEAWERAGVQSARRLLDELGFAGVTLRLQDLERALDDELRALGPPADEPAAARALLLQAMHALARLRLDAAARQLDATRAERDKLRDDLAEANRRARLLAQDVDESHARMEAERAAALRQAEARHTEAARAAAEDAAAERERAATLRRALDEETARRVEAEARLRSDTTVLHQQIKDLQEQSAESEKRAAAAEREAARAADEAAAAERRAAAAAERERAAADDAAALQRELRAESQRLRDRNDELAAALEASTRRDAGRAPRAPSWLDEVAMYAPAHQTPESSNSNHILEKLQMLFDNKESQSDDCPKCAAARHTLAALHGVEDCAAADSDKIPPAPATQKTEAHAQTDGDDAEALRGELAEARRAHERHKREADSVIGELEAQVARLRAELERCEEEWAARLEEERELLAEEQRAGDERLAELAAKIDEYERQFARPRLPPIAESAALERQVADLELEHARYRRAADAQLQARAEEVQRLQRRLQELERRAPQPAPAQPQRDTPTCACACGAGAADAALARWRAAAGAHEAAALRARAARAERAAHRLHARLAAADLLVKDLYIENCRLALPQHPRLP